MSCDVSFRTDRKLSNEETLIETVDDETVKLFGYHALSDT